MKTEKRCLIKVYRGYKELNNILRSLNIPVTTKNRQILIQRFWYYFNDRLLQDGNLIDYLKDDIKSGTHDFEMFKED